MTSKRRSLNNLFLGIKRWILMILTGLVLATTGILFFLNDMIAYIKLSDWIKGIFILLGAMLIAIGIKKSLSIVFDVMSKNKKCSGIDKSSLNEMLYKENTLVKGPKIVAIGGGTGLSTLLRGLKEHTGNITAIVTVADDGGGSGVLREEMGILPPGDIRNCLLALANTEPALEKLLSHRFDKGRLQGQSFGNLFLAAMNDIHGDFTVAVKEMSNVLAVRGKVLPMTIQNIKLCAELENGKIVEGESNIPDGSIAENSPIKRVFTVPEKLEPLREAIEAIREASCIVIGPGSLYTSLIPNLLVKEIAEEIQKSKANKIYVANIMTQPGETQDYTILDHIEAIERHTSRDMINFVVSNSQRLDRRILSKYKKDNSTQLVITESEREQLAEKGIQVYEGNLVDIVNGSVRHSKGSAELIMNVCSNCSEKTHKKKQ